MAETASGTAQHVMRETRHWAGDLVEGVRQNPIPALMIGAGVAWLLMERSRKSRDEHAEHAEHAEWSEYAAPRYRTYQESDYSSASPSEGIPPRATEVASQARLGARAARRTQTGLQRMMRENPLLVGAAAVLVGAAVGASLPETERENEWMGEARDSVVDRAQEAARGASSAVQEVAKAGLQKG